MKHSYVCPTVDNEEEDRRISAGLCQMCGREKAGELKICPYSEEIGDGTKACNCCTLCTKECLYDI